MDTDSPDIYTDAAPIYVPPTEVTYCSSQTLDMIISKLDVDDYRSIFFLLMDFIGPRNFLYFMKKDKSYLKDKFLNKYYEFDSKDTILIEIFGTMQRYDLLKILGTCEHVYQKDKDTMNQISQLWKSLYSVCDQLTDSDLLYYKEKLFPGVSMMITCAEELLCQAFVKNIFHENDLSKLKEVFKDRSDCFRLISSYTGASKLSYYPIRRPTRNSPCGMAVILNHERFWAEPNDTLHLTERTGSDIDAVSLKNMWESFGFIANIHRNYTDDQVLQLFRRLSLEDHSSYDAFVVCYLSHGDEGIVYSSNSKAIQLVHLMGIMANNCSTLINKPKLFFIQACSGRQVQQGVGISPQSLPSTPGVVEQRSKMSLNTPLYSDILFFFSSFPGFVSFRTSAGNSWFIDELVKAMEKYGEELTILNVVTIVTNEVAKKSGGVPRTGYTHCKQIPICSKTLKYELKLKKLLQHTNLESGINN